MSQRPFKILSIEHVGIAVDDLNGISDIFGGLFGIELRSREKIDDQLVITDIYETGSGKLEFLKATSKDSPIARFIDKKSSGIHHIALLVDHLQPAINYLKDKGVQLIDEKPRIGAEGLSIAFIHPKSSGGILVELCEKK